MNSSQQVRASKSYGARAQCPKPVPIPSPRQSPITDIRALTRLVFEGYQTSFGNSGPKVQRRYKKLMRDLAECGKA